MPITAVFTHEQDQQRQSLGMTVEEYVRWDGSPAQFVSCLRCGLDGWIVGATHKRDCPLCERTSVIAPTPGGDEK